MIPVILVLLLLPATSAAAGADVSEEGNCVYTEAHGCEYSWDTPQKVTLTTAPSDLVSYRVPIVVCSGSGSAIGCAIYCNAGLSKDDVGSLKMGGRAWTIDPDPESPCIAETGYAHVTIE